MRPKGQYKRNLYRVQVSAGPLKLRISSSYLPEARIACPAVSPKASRTRKDYFTKSERYNVTEGLTVARLLAYSH